MSDSDPTDDPAQLPSIEELLARLAPPTTPDEAIGYAPQIIDSVASLDSPKAMSIIAGLMTDPRFQTHQIRLDYALRIVFAMARGSRRPKQQEIRDLLNIELVQARVARLEDPIEDFFVESLPTREGEFFIFSGGWEKASIHTELILEAFRQLPDGEPKTKALRSIFALLRLSTALVKRADIEPGTIGGGISNSEMAIPSDTRLTTLAGRVRFSSADLRQLGISEEGLKPFFFSKRPTQLMWVRASQATRPSSFALS